MLGRWASEGPEGQGKWWGLRAKGCGDAGSLPWGLFVRHGVSLAAQLGLFTWVLRSAGHGGGEVNTCFCVCVCLGRGVSKKCSQKEYPVGGNFLRSPVFYTEDLSVLI